MKATARGIIQAVAENEYTYPGLNNFQDVYDPFQEYVTEHNIFVTSDGQVYILNDPPLLHRIPVRLLCIFPSITNKLPDCTSAGA